MGMAGRGGGRLGECARPPMHGGSEGGAWRGNGARGYPPWPVGQEQVETRAQEQEAEACVERGAGMGWA